MLSSKPLSRYFRRGLQDERLEKFTTKTMVYIVSAGSRGMGETDPRVFSQARAAHENVFTPGPSSKTLRMGPAARQRGESQTDTTR